MSRFSHDLVRKARQVDLALFLLSRGEPLHKTGRRYRHKDYDSLVITGNMFYWNSRLEKGNSLDFVMLYYDWDFRTAINELTGSSIPNVEFFNTRQSLNISKGADVKRVIAYLCKTRKITYKVVRFLIENRFISQDERGNAVFKIYDEHLELVGAEMVGTLSSIRFKSLAVGSKLGYGFNFTIGEPLYNLFFESPIDLMSFWSIYYDRLNSHRLISLAGLRKDIFDNIISVFNISLNSVFLCVDNDDAGKRFANSIVDIYPDVKSFLPVDYKDWNEFLKSFS